MSVQSKDVSYCSLSPGDGTLTRRILKRCRKECLHFSVETEPVKIGYGRWGCKTTGYRVPLVVYREETTRRVEELAVRRRAAAEATRVRRERWRQERLAMLENKFPELSGTSIQSFVDDGVIAYALDEVGYQYGIGTQAYWKLLGYRVCGPAHGVVVKGRQLFKVYEPSSLKEVRSRITPLQVVQKWLSRCESKELVLADLIRIANRLQKVKKLSDFYSLKDKWMQQNQDHLVEGCISRHEIKKCWSCDGSGEWHFDECERCDGSGIYSSRTLYEHTFEIGKRRFIFHSYVRPRVVGDKKGADLQHYGRPFTPQELPLPPQSVIVAAIKLIME